ncbi:MAG: glycosyltransferase family protein [Gemmatimonadota bacterium]
MTLRPLRIVFLVQGEGRGHLSQALALAELLENAGHEVVCVLAGTSERRPLPDYFSRGLGQQVITFPSLLTVPGGAGTGVSMWRTVAVNTRRIFLYRNGIRLVRKILSRLQPDLVVNFYEALGAMALGAGGLERIPMVCVGHQYLLGHPGAPRPPFRPVQLLPFRVLNRLSVPSGAVRAALSFRELPDLRDRGLEVIPPLLRKSVLEARPEPGEHLLVYVLNHGYGRAIARWHESHPEIVIHGFWDRPGAPDTEVVRPNLTFHQLSDTRFMEFMRTCRGFVGTAGFESVAEALWLGKPVMVVPTEKHVEQAWNGREAVAAGAGICRDSFDLTPFLDYLPQHRDVSPVYRDWVRRGHGKLVRLLERMATGTSPMNPN